MKRIILCISLFLFATFTSANQEKSSYVNENCIVFSTTAYCEGGTGHFLPKELKTDVRFLNIVDCNMNSLTDDDFSFLVNVRTLFVDSSNIPLTPGISLFSRLQNLESFRINNSNVTVGIANLFPSSTNILILNLRRNNLTRISQDFFRKFTHVELIDVSENQISEIEVDAFLGLSSLKEIDLSNNRIGMKFDSSFLSLTSRCVLCATLPNTMECPNNAANRCEDNADVDALWREFSAKHILYMGENPVCKSIASTAVYSALLSQSGPIESSATNDSCQLLSAGNCPKHEERQVFLRRVCAIQSRGARKNADSSSLTVGDRNGYNISSEEYPRSKSSRLRLCRSMVSKGDSDNCDSEGQLRIFLIRILLFPLTMVILIAMYFSSVALVQHCRKAITTQFDSLNTYIVLNPVGSPPTRSV